MALYIIRPRSLYQAKRNLSVTLCSVRYYTVTNPLSFYMASWCLGLRHPLALHVGAPECCYTGHIWYWAWRVHQKVNTGKWILPFLAGANSCNFIKVNVKIKLKISRCRPSDLQILQRWVLFRKTIKSRVYYSKLIHSLSFAIGGRAYAEKRL